MSVPEIDAAVAPWAGRLRLLVAHLSDIHAKVPGRAYPRTPQAWLATHGRETEAALAEVEALARRPDLVAITGDLTDSDEPEEYEAVGRLLDACRIPVLLVPGNHDRVVRPGFPDGRFRECHGLLLRRPAGPDHPDGPEFLFERRVGAWRVVGVDTSRYHEMSARHRADAARILGDPEAPPTVVLTHSPLLPVGNWVDADAFHDAAFMAEFVRFPSVRAVLSGHVHKARAWRYRRAVHVTAPSLSYGIGDGVGYCLVGLGEDRVLFALRRLVPGTLRDYYDPVPRPQTSHVDRLEPVVFEGDPLCNPHVWPWRPDPGERD